MGDNKTGSERKLSLACIHDEKIVSLGDNHFFACADFKEAGTGKIIDLDFYATHSNNNWTIDPAPIHKVAGKPRFTYNANNQRADKNLIRALPQLGT